MSKTPGNNFHICKTIRIVNPSLNDGPLEKVARIVGACFVKRAGQGLNTEVIRGAPQHAYPAKIFLQYRR